MTSEASSKRPGSAKVAAGQSASGANAQPLTAAHEKAHVPAPLAHQTGDAEVLKTADADLINAALPLRAAKGDDDVMNQPQKAPARKP